MRRGALSACVPALWGIGLLAGCNNYPVLRVTGYEQATFNNRADILFVIDNSGSMRDNESQLALNFNTFLATLTSAEGSNVAQNTLADAVNNYIRETTTSSGPIDYQLAITTTTVDYASGGETAGIDPGETGLLMGPVITRDQGDVETAFQQQLLCNTVYWNEAELVSDPSYTPNGDGTCPVPAEEVSREYLNCLCGGSYSTSEGAGTEEGIEAALEALCRAEDGAPEGCWQNDNATIPISAADAANTNTGLLREDATTVVVIVTDEGDWSRRVANSDPDPQVYLDLFGEFTNPVRFAIIGPPYHDQDGSCLDGASTWGTERYQAMATNTNGAYYDLTAIDAACTPNDWSQNLEELGTLLANLLTVFPLQAVPDVSTIRVYIDGEEVSESQIDPPEGSIEAGTATYTSGWTYDSGENAVVFHGDAVPGYNADVKIYYKPLGGMPRELPF